MGVLYQEGKNENYRYMYRRISYRIHWRKYVYMPDAHVNLVLTDFCEACADGNLQKGYFISFTTGLIAAKWSKDSLRNFENFQ